MSQHINLSVIEETPLEIPEEVQRMGMEALQILWQTSQNIAQQEIENVKKHYQQCEIDISQQRQDALNKVAQINSEIAVANNTIESLKRESKSLQVDVNRKIGELKSAEDQILLLQDKVVQQEHEVKRLTEELGRAREQAEGLKKRLYEVNRQAEQDRTALKEVRQESAVNLHTRERLEKNLKTAMQETEEVWKQFKREQTRAAVADALVQEMKETSKKYESDIKLLKEEKHELKENLETETKARVEMEKKIAMLMARADSQEWGYKEMITRLEQELEIAKTEATTFRNRMVKSEGALEREKKALERLETKLVAASGGGKF